MGELQAWFLQTLTEMRLLRCCNDTCCIIDCFFTLYYAMKDLSHPNLPKQYMNASVQRLYCIQLFFLSPHSTYSTSHSTFHSSVFNPVRKSNWILESWSLKDRGPSVTAGSFSSTDPGYAEKKMEPYEALTVTRVKLQGQGSKDSKNA